MCNISLFLSHEPFRRVFTYLMDLVISSKEIKTKIKFKLLNKNQTLNIKIQNMSINNTKIIIFR